MIRRTMIAAAIFVAALGAYARAADTVRFPEVTGKNLHGDAVTFPSAFKSTRYNLVIVAFEQEQQQLVDTWLPKLETLAQGRQDFAYYELPTIARMNPLMRWVIYRGMRSGIKDSAARSRTVTLHIKKEPFRKALRIANETDIYLFLVDSEGKVSLRMRGPYTEPKLERLTEALLRE